MYKLKSKKEKAEVGIDLPQPLTMDGAAIPTTRRESTLGDAAYQEKRKMAARELFKTYEAWEPSENESCSASFHHLVHCNPRDLFFRLDEQWVKVTEEDIVAILPDNAEEIQGVGKEDIAEIIVDDLRQYCKDAGKVSWTLPRIERQEGGAK